MKEKALQKTLNVIAVTLILFLLTNEVCFSQGTFRESNDLQTTEFFLAPMLPNNFMQAGKKYSVNNLYCKNVKFNLSYEVKKSNLIVITVDYKIQTPLSVIVSQRNGKKVIAQKEKISEQNISFDASNGDVFIVRFN